MHNEPLRNAAIICECDRDANFTPFARTVTTLTLGTSYALSRRGTLVHEQNERSRPSYGNRRWILVRYRPRAAIKGTVLLPRIPYITVLFDCADIIKNLGVVQIDLELLD